ncbi:MAG: hypothetical protein ACREJM_07880 [Candidatus Saccharimonadales bacterium]
MPRQRKPQKRIRVRSKRLDEIDDTKLALAFWLMAKRLVDEQDAAEADEAPNP